MRIVAPFALAVVPVTAAALGKTLQVLPEDAIASAWIDLGDNVVSTFSINRNQDSRSCQLQMQLNRTF
jgi:hypothetical protein